MLLPAQLARVNAALAVADANLAEAQRLTPNGLEYLWAWGTGASSSASALVTDWAATASLTAELHAKADRWRSSPVPVEDVEVADFERAAGMTSNEGARATAEQLKPSTAARQVAAAFVTPSAWPSWVRTLAVVAVAGVVAALLLPPLLAALLSPRARR